MKAGKSGREELFPESSCFNGSFFKEEPLKQEDFYRTLVARKIIFPFFGKRTANKQTTTMKNIKIFPKDWLALHPYKQSTPVDSYYTGIANRIYDILIETELINSFEDDEPKQIAIRLAAYFEDVISELNIWRTFITTYHEMYGKYLPFYEPDDHYYDDEVNYEDVRFLLWHYTQQYHGYRKGTFVNPDNPANELTARMVYQLFCDEWTTAPENERMRTFLSAENRFENQEAYETLLFWFHYHNYLLTDSDRELTEQTRRLWETAKKENLGVENLIMTLHDHQAYLSKTAMLALTSPQWLARILASHPDADFLKTAAAISTKRTAKENEEKRQENQAVYENFRAAAGERLLLYFDKVSEAKAFVKEKIRLSAEEEYVFPDTLGGKKLALYATPEEGLQLLAGDLPACIHDETNPFYQESVARAKGISFFVVKNCSVSLLKTLEEKGMLQEAQTKSLISPERGKAIIHENWKFLARYFLREDPDATN